jgi:hypothetical protein
MITRRLSHWLLSAAILIFIAGCSEDVSPPSAPSKTSDDDILSRTIHDPPPPDGLVTADLGGDAVTFWPYTGASFDGQTIDPINLLFAGAADPVRIRAALLALDGDRTAFGFPDAYPFNATWSDAIGDVQTSYEEEGDWLGSVLQLQLGAYDPIRWHLRLFRTGNGFSGSGVWTIAGAHFEILIPGTADHAVLSWERAEEIVVVDFIRSGLLDPTMPFVPTGVINATPTYREIPAPVYNGLPDELRAYIGGPLGQVTEPVPIPTDGKATVLNLAGAAAIVPGTVAQDFTLTYQLAVPKPFCSDGPEDWLLVEGPVHFHQTVEVRADGGYVYHSDYAGALTATPWDIVNNEPVGEPYDAEVSSAQNGHEWHARCSVFAHDQKIGRQADGTEFLRTRLEVSTPGHKSFRLQTHCL